MEIGISCSNSKYSIIYFSSNSKLSNSSSMTYYSYLGLNNCINFRLFSPKYILTSLSFSLNITMSKYNFLTRIFIINSNNKLNNYASCLFFKINKIYHTYSCSLITMIFIFCLNMNFRISTFLMILIIYSKSKWKSIFNYLGCNNKFA